MGHFKKITIEEWNKISPKLVRWFCLNFLKRIKKIIEINGNRLETFHLNQIKKEINDELGEGVEDNEDNYYKTKIGEEKDFTNNIKLKPFYNNEALLKMKKKKSLN